MTLQLLTKTKDKTKKSHITIFGEIFLIFKKVYNLNIFTKAKLYIICLYYLLLLLHKHYQT